MKTREMASFREAELVKARERASLKKAVVETEMRPAHERAFQAEEMAVLAEKDLEIGLADILTTIECAQ